MFSTDILCRMYGYHVPSPRFLLTFYVGCNVRRKRGDDPWYPYILHNMSEENVVMIHGIHTSYIICQKKTW